MASKLTSVLVMCFALMFAGCESSALSEHELASCPGFQPLSNWPEAVALNDQQPWVILGSSSAKGAGASSPSTSWAGLLAEKAPEGVALVNLAVGGTTTYQALSSGCSLPESRTRFAPLSETNVDAAIALDPQWVIISFPSNDQANGFSVEETVHNLEQIISALYSQGIAVMVLSSQPREMREEWKPRLIAVDNLMASKMGACWVDVYTPLAFNGLIKPEYDFDGVHLNDAGHQVVFDAISTAMERQLCVQL